MRVRVGINGMGRIGRDLLRIATDRSAEATATGIEVVAVNDLAKPETVAHLLKQHRADPRRRADGEGLRLVRQRVGLRPAHGGLVEMVARLLPER